MAAALMFCTGGRAGGPATRAACCQGLGAETGANASTRPVCAGKQRTRPGPRACPHARRTLQLIAPPLAGGDALRRVRELLAEPLSAPLRPLDWAAGGAGKGLAAARSGVLGSVSFGGGGRGGAGEDARMADASAELLPVPQMQVQRWTGVARQAAARRQPSVVSKFSGCGP